MVEWAADTRVWTLVIVAAVLLAAALLLRRSKIPAVRYVARMLGLVVSGILLVFLFIRPFVLGTFIIPSASMYPTLKKGDYIFVNNFIYRFRSPRHGEVVVFRAPKEIAESGGDEDWIKRVIGLPGDIVEVSGGVLYLDGKKQDEPYINEQMDYGMAAGQVPAGKVFLLGDNRNDSYDGHDWGPLDKDRVIGRATFVFWPFNRIGYIR